MIACDDGDELPVFGVWVGRSEDPCTERAPIRRVTIDDDAGGAVGLFGEKPDESGAVSQPRRGLESHETVVSGEGAGWKTTCGAATTI